MAASEVVPEGFLDTIVNVQWGGLELVTVEFSYETLTNFTEGFDPPPFIATLSGDVNGAITGALGPSIGPPNVPDSKFRSSKDRWCYAPFNFHFTSTTTEPFTIIDRGLYTEGTNLGQINDLTVPIQGHIVPFYIDYTGSTTGEGDGLHVYNGYNPHGDGSLGELTDTILINFAILAGFGAATSVYPILSSIVSSHVAPSTVTFDHVLKATVTFINLSKLKGGVGKSLDFSMLVIGQPLTTAAKWDITVATWKKRPGDPPPTFPAKGQFPRDITVPDDTNENPIIRELLHSNIPNAPVSISTQSIAMTSESTMPSYLVNISIDTKTLQVTTSKTAL